MDSAISANARNKRRFLMARKRIEVRHDQNSHIPPNRSDNIINQRHGIVEIMPQYDAQDMLYSKFPSLVRYSVQRAPLSDVSNGWTLSSTMTGSAQRQTGLTHNDAQRIKKSAEARKKRISMMKMKKLKASSASNNLNNKQFGSCIKQSKSRNGRASRVDDQERLFEVPIQNIPEVDLNHNVLLHVNCSKKVCPVHFTTVSI
ncbi:OLC1v1012291C1 [Oldenlandia corymbosa var. corymbosa]|uniref:OLC1v1012291C1 n=1 Tax=Oldenlandia corymbosa var. corymbosa TaxID=529605 RepID=A0AAV1DVN8_OLDCO|nr:OLC1v1012291C1 [Oldenlandia corymbosa var. corymbosa]